MRTTAACLAVMVLVSAWGCNRSGGDSLYLPQYKAADWAKFDQPAPPASCKGLPKYRMGSLNRTGEEAACVNMVKVCHHTCDIGLYYHFMPEYIRTDKRKAWDKMVGKNRLRFKKLADEIHARGGTFCVHSYEAGGKLRGFVESAINNKLNREHVLGLFDKRIKFMESRFYELFHEMPYIDGFVITTGEGQSRNQSPEDFKAYVMAVYRAMQRASKEDGHPGRYIIVRNWIKGCLPGREHLFFPVTNDPEINKSIIIRTKLEADDVAPWGGLNSLIGQKTGHKIMVEQAMLYQEYGGFNWYPFDLVTKMRNLYVRALHAGTIGASIGKFNRKYGLPLPPYPSGDGWSSGYGQTWNYWSDYNNSVWLEVVKNPTRDLDEIKRQWAEKKFGPRGAKVVQAILDRSFEAMIRFLTVEGFYQNSHSTFKNSIRGLAIGARPILGDTDGLTHRPFNVPGLRRADMRVNRANTERLVKWKHRGVELVDEMIDILVRNRKAMKTDAYDWMLANLLSMRSYGLAFENYDGSCLWFKYWKKTKDPAEKEYAKQRILEMVARLEKLVANGPDFLARQGPKSPLFAAREIRLVVTGKVKDAKLSREKPPTIKIPRLKVRGSKNLPAGSIVIEVEDLPYRENTRLFVHKKASGGKAIELPNSWAACAGRVKIPAGKYLLTVYGYGRIKAMDAGYVKIGENHVLRTWFHQWGQWSSNQILLFDKTEEVNIQVLSGEPGVVFDKIILTRTKHGKGKLKTEHESGL